MRDDVQVRFVTFHPGMYECGQKVDLTKNDLYALVALVFSGETALWNATGAALSAPVSASWKYSTSTLASVDKAFGPGCTSTCTKPVTGWLECLRAGVPTRIHYNPL